MCAFAFAFVCVCGSFDRCVDEGTTTIVKTEKVNIVDNVVASHSVNSHKHTHTRTPSTRDLDHHTLLAVCGRQRQRYDVWLVVGGDGGDVQWNVNVSFFRLVRI